MENKGRNLLKSLSATVPIFTTFKHGQKVLLRSSILHFIKMGYMIQLLILRHRQRDGCGLKTSLSFLLSKKRLEIQFTSLRSTDYSSNAKDESK